MITEMLNTLNDMQKKAVLKTDGPLLLLAGAGSGKTRVLTHRIAYLIENGISPYNIMAITFTNKAAREMKERVEKLALNGDKVWVSTFHSTCVRILRYHIDRIGYKKQFTIYDADDSEKLIKEILKLLNIDDKKFSVKMIMSKIGEQKDNLITADEYIQISDSNFMESKIAQIYKVYQKRLSENNALDFDDLIFKTVELFKKCPDVLEKYQERFKYIMIDEYQDTNTSQYNLIKLLSSKYKNLCVVGDDDQSIYGWRGANIRNILDFENDFTNAQVIKLEQNYRSTQLILDCANEVIKNNFGRKSKKLWTENEKGQNIKFFRGSSDLEEAMFISNEISSKVSKGSKYSDFAVLYRNNSLSRIIEDRFVKNSIPYRIFGGIRFYERKEIKDIMSYLKVIYNPSDDIAVKRIINVPRRGIGDASIQKLSNYAQNNSISFYEAINDIHNIEELKTRAKKITEFAQLINSLIQASKNLSVADLIDYILTSTGYIKELENENTEESISRIDNIQELVSKAAEFETATDEPSLSAFLEEVSLVADIDGYSENDDTVVLMTIHSSKGLEFPNVFIAGFEEGIFPSYRSMIENNPNIMEEERRLCYVGITRAKSKLYLTCAKTRLQHGEYISNMPSRFFKEIPAKYMDIDSVVNKTNTNNLNSSVSNSGSFKSKTSYTGGLKTYNSYNKIPSPQNKELDFKTGDKVRQIKYGIGTIKDIKPAGADYEVTIDFPDIGTKKLMAFLSKLKKV